MDHDWVEISGQPQISLICDLSFRFYCAVKIRELDLSGGGQWSPSNYLARWIKSEKKIVMC